MGLESGTYISDFNTANPLAGDGKAQGDDHIRLIKTLVKNTFPNANGAINPTPAEFNTLVGVGASAAVPTNGTNMDVNRASDPSYIVPVNTRLSWLHLFGLATGVPNESALCTLPVGSRPISSLPAISGAVLANATGLLHTALFNITTAGVVSVQTIMTTDLGGYTLGPNDQIFLDCMIVKS